MCKDNTKDNSTIETSKLTESISEVLQTSEKVERSPDAQPDELESFASNYIRVLNGNASNAFIYAENSPRHVKHDAIANVDTLEGCFGVSIIGHSLSENGLSAQTQKLFVVLLRQLTLNLPNRRDATIAKIENARQIWFTLAEYAEICGLSSLEKAREQYAKAIQELRDISLAWQEYVYVKPDNKPNARRRKTLMSYATPIAGQAGAEPTLKPVQNNICHFNFDMDFAKYVCQHNFIMPIPRSVFYINTKYNPNSLAFLWELSKNTNENYRNIDRRHGISVKVLLSRAPRIPRYKDIVKRGRINELIFQPFDRDLFALRDKYHALSRCEYTTRDGQPVEREQLSGLTYSEFVTLQIRYELQNYPDDTQLRRLQKEDERQARYKKMRQTANNGTDSASDDGKEQPNEADSTGAPQPV